VNRNFLIAGLLLAFPVTVAQAASEGVAEKLYITNSDGDDVTVVDVPTHKVLKRIVVGKHPHGIAVPKAQDFILVTIEGTKPGQMVWIDPVTDTVTKRMNIGPAPNQLAVTPDGKIAYVPCEDGHYDVVDVAKRKIIKRIKTGGRGHNTLVSPDGKKAYLAPTGAPQRVTVVDTKSHKKIAEIPFGGSVRPVVLDPKGKWLFAQVDGLLGFEAADLAKNKVVHRVPVMLSEEQKAKKIMSRSHGIGVRPDGKELWSCDVENHEVHIFDLTGDKPKQIATLPMGERVYWLTFRPDGKVCYVSVRGKNEVAAVDTTTKKVLARIPAGKVPKRLIVVTLPQK
jgi:YVTN family beta-propeller protein